MTNILGLNTYHGDSAACLVQDGKLVAAVEEERFRRIKHWAGFPERSIGYCLEAGGITLADVEYISVNSDSRAHLFRKIIYALKNKPNPGFVLERIKNRRQRGDIKGELARAFPGSSFTGEVVGVEHHLAHLASAHTVSPFAESVAVSVDGFGDFSSAAWGVCQGSAINIDHRVFFPHSLGIFYSALTQFLGFPHYGDEYKVMGLAPLGKPVYLDQLRQVVQTHENGTFTLDLDFFLHHRHGVDYQWKGGRPVVGRLFTDELAILLGFPPRTDDQLLEQCHHDLARSVQAMYEEAFFHLLGAAHAQYRMDTLTLAGGCAMNSVANGKVYRRTPFKQIYIQAAAGDAGGAVGAAFALWHDISKKAERIFVMDHAYMGPEFSSAEIQELLKAEGKQLFSKGCGVERIENEESLCELTARAIADGKVIGWFQGRMEWGPRALGNRSILCDPRRPDMKGILNSTIKRRESFRPFAPSVLRQEVDQWFEEDDDVPFMMQVFQVRPEKRGVIPAVVHVDGSGRLQTVTQKANPLYFLLISSFYALTGIPMLLNTSFNENEPIVCTPEQALDCFLRTRMDVLVLGNFFITR